MSSNEPSNTTQTNNNKNCMYLRDIISLYLTVTIIIHYCVKIPQTHYDVNNDHEECFDWSAHGSVCGDLD